jgi:hypothetical protein
MGLFALLSVVAGGPPVHFCGRRPGVRVATMMLSSAYLRGCLLLLACSLSLPPTQAQVSLAHVTIDAAAREWVINESLKELVGSYVCQM